jgi:hypothetical protein
MLLSRVVPSWQRLADAKRRREEAQQQRQRELDDQAKALQVYWWMFDSVSS